MPNHCLNTYKVSGKSNEKWKSYFIKTLFSAYFCHFWGIFGPFFASKARKKIFPGKTILEQYLYYWYPCFDRISGKNNDRIKSYLRKTSFLSYFGPFLPFFGPKKGQNDFFSKKGLCYSFSLIVMYLCAKFQKKLM